MIQSTIALTRWQDLSPLLRRDVASLQIDSAQVEFAGTLERALQGLDAQAGDERLGVAILADGAVVGFLLVKRGSQAPAWAAKDMAVVASMRVDHRRQGQGHGSAALRALPRWLRLLWPDCGRLALSVDEDNARGIAAYARAGFVDTGQRDAGRIGWVRYMALPDEASADGTLNTKPDLFSQ